MLRSLRLISLSNYVFVLEISQISGIVENVSMLIMVVMRICCNGRKERRGGQDREEKPYALIDSKTCFIEDACNKYYYWSTFNSNSTVASKLGTV